MAVKNGRSLSRRALDEVAGARRMSSARSLLGPTWVAVAVLSILAGCAGDDQGNNSIPSAGPTQSAPSAGAQAVEADATETDEALTAADEGEGGSVEMTGFQEDILADGVVTDREMFLAMQATVKCIQRHGFEASISEQPSGGWSLTTSYQPHQAERVDDVTDLCERQHSMNAQLRYAVGRQPPETDIDVAWDCLLERGVLDGSEPDPTIAFQLADAANPGVTWECIELGQDG